ncbi:hypothetical protein D9613_009672 [Agrocybe pediades]|uniref:HMG box domain-containing protein n=1 Tax=Agrocybe pediades TaxID=84607 RepID=A0A8H4QXY9_9AGAR|nr:hypothetical protein D9613_009672 [Agrocybe pediades]
MPALRTREIQFRTLEVSTEAPSSSSAPSAPPQLPTLNIVSPTPRAFTFPTTHNLADSPYSSRSNSPFEPDHLSFASQCSLSSSNLPLLPPSSSPLSTSPSSSSTSSSTTPTTTTTNNMEKPFFDFDYHMTQSKPRPLTPDFHQQQQQAFSAPASPVKRRKSTASSTGTDALERRPKKGDEDYVKRPENAFILYRRKCCEERQAAQEAAAAAEKAGAQGGAGAAGKALSAAAKKQRQADLSKTISQQWKTLSNEERKYWEDLAKSKKLEHEKRYPNYVYRPQRAKDKDGKVRNKKTSVSAASLSAPASTSTPSSSSPATATTSGSSPLFASILMNPAPASLQSDRVLYEAQRLQNEQLSAMSTNTVSFTIPLSRQQVTGRTNSSSTQPEYETVYAPNIFNVSGGESNGPHSIGLGRAGNDNNGVPVINNTPSSPSLLPYISKRSSSYPGVVSGGQGGFMDNSNAMSSFDYVPDPNYVPPFATMAGSGQFEASLQSSEFLRSMFSTSNNHSSSTRGPSPLEQLTLSSESTLLPAHNIISPSSSISSSTSGSSSSGPSSPQSGPYTPTYDLSTLEAQAQAEMDKQMELQMQENFSRFTWHMGHDDSDTTSDGQTNVRANRDPGSSEMLSNADFDIDAIRASVMMGSAKYDGGHQHQYNGHGHNAMDITSDGYMGSMNLDSSASSGRPTDFDMLYSADHMLDFDRPFSMPGVDGSRMSSGLFDGIDFDDIMAAPHY